MLNTYYEDICNHIGATATKYLEKHLLTTDGRRSSIDRQEALNSGKVNDKQLKYLEDRHLIRRIKTDNVSIRYEYIHDLFAKMIKKKNSEYRVQMWKPKYSTISKRTDVGSFLHESLFWVAFIFFYGACNHFFMTKVGERDSFLHSINGIMYFLVFGLSAFLLPTTVKRLHDTGHSGWFVAGIPPAFLLCSMKALFPAINNSLLGKIILVFAAISGGGYSLFFLYLLFNPSVVRSYRAAASLRYETIHNSSCIKNSEFALGFSAELIFWLVSCLVADLLYILITKEVVINKLIAGPIYEYFKVVIVAYPFFLFFPIVICFFPSLKSRIATLGYNRNWGFVPIANLFFLVIGFLPDTLLTKLHLYRGGKQNREQQDNIFAQLNDSFTPMVAYNIKAISPGFWKGFLLLIVPFYAIIQLYGKNRSPKERAHASTFVGLHYIISYLAFFLTLAIHQSDDIFMIILSVFFFIETICFLIYSFTDRKTRRGIILGIIRESPHLSRSEIAALLNWNSKLTNKLIDKLLEKGLVRRTDTDGEVTWEIVELSELQKQN